MINEEEIDRFADAYEANTGNFPTLSMAAYDGANWAIEQLQPENDALKAENERLRDALEYVLSMTDKSFIDCYERLYSIKKYTEKALNP